MSKTSQVPSDVLEKVVKFFGRNAIEFEEDVEAVREWTRSQPHLPEIPDAQTVRNFLILNKCSVEKTKQKLDRYYTVRSKLEEIYGKINPKLPHMQEYAKIMYFTPHRKLTDDMYRVIYFKLRDKTMIDRMEPINAMRHMTNMMEVRLQDDIMFGDVYVFDCKDLPVSYLVKVTPMFIYNFFVVILQDVFSFRVKALYVTNLHPFGDKLIAITKKVMKAKLLERMHFPKNYDFLRDFLSPDEIPRDFGGEGPTLEELQDDLRRKFVEYEDHFDRVDKMRVDENLRPEKLTNDDVLGYFGNFKKLNLD